MLPSSQLLHVSATKLHQHATFLAVAVSLKNLICHPHIPSCRL